MVVSIDAGLEESVEFYNAPPVPLEPTTNFNALCAAHSFVIEFSVFDVGKSNKKPHLGLIQHKTYSITIRVSTWPEVHKNKCQS